MAAFKADAAVSTLPQHLSCAAGRKWGYAVDGGLGRAERVGGVPTPQKLFDEVAKAPRYQWFGCSREVHGNCRSWGYNFVLTLNRSLYPPAPYIGAEAQR